MTSINTNIFKINNLGGLESNKPTGLIVDFLQGKIVQEILNPHAKF